MWDEFLVRIVQAVFALLLSWLGGGCTAAVPSAAIQNYPPSVEVQAVQNQTGEGPATANVGPLPQSQPSR